MPSFEIYIIIKHKWKFLNRQNRHNMDKIKYLTALLLSKTARIAIKLSGKSKATSAPGMLAMKICPDFIKHAANANGGKIITVTGTNGKTTTTGILAHIIKENSKHIIHNTEGANMLTGIASALSQGTKFHKKCDYLIFESDEAYLRKLYEFLRADYLLVTNLFRDQLDRYGELDITYKKIKSAIDENPDLTVFINADDPTLEDIAAKNKKIYFGLENVTYGYKTKDSQAPAENTACPRCGKPLRYGKRFYAHIGHYECDCGYTRPQVKYLWNAEVFDSYSILKINFDDKNYEFKLSMPGLYNVYNAMGAISMALELGVSGEVIQNALTSYTSVFGRAEMTKIHGKKVLVQLIKNPVGASEVIRQIQGFENSKLVFILNDNYADGRDVSWIWDADFESLNSYKGKVYISGTRAYDAALRLKYAGVDTKLLSVEKDIKSTLDKALSEVQDNETLLVLPTYTALLEMQILYKKEK